MTSVEKRNEKMKFSEQMDVLREKAEDIKGALDTLINCKEAGNLKQVSYWVGKVSHDLGDLCRECMGEELLKAIKERKSKGRIIT
jgi:primosomal protein N''